MKKTVEFTGEELEMILTIVSKIGGRDPIGGFRQKADEINHSLIDLNEKYPFVSETTTPEIYHCLRFIENSDDIWISDI